MSRPWRRARVVLAAAKVAVVAATLAACSGGGDDQSDADGSADPASTTVVGAAAATTAASGPPMAPLLGLEIEDPAVAQRPAMAVKVGNTDFARPQAGINQADVVFEEIVEAGLTRLVAVFQSTVPAQVGPIRSARLTDISIVFPFGQPLFVSSGGNPETMGAVEQTGLTDVNEAKAPDAFIRREDREPPDDLYALGDAVYAQDTALAVAPGPLLFHRPAGVEASGGRPVQGIEVEYGGTTVAFRWDGDGGVWRRDQNGSPHVDEEGVQAAPQNVIVQFVEYTATDQVDANGTTVERAVLDGVGGEVWVLTDGMLIEGTWFKGNFTNPTTFTSADDQIIGLTPGRTWILLPEPGTADAID